MSDYNTGGRGKTRPVTTGLLRWRTW